MQFVNRFCRCAMNVALAGILFLLYCQGVVFGVEDLTANPPGAGAAVLYPDPPYSDPPREDTDEYGGWLGLQGTATGFFHTEQVGNRWWLVTPKGNVFFNVGVIDGSAVRLKAWGLNSSYAGGDRPDTADEGLPYMLNLTFLRLAKRDLPTVVRPGLPPWFTLYDVFDPEWAVQCEEYANSQLKPHANDPMLIGYWIDNEPGLVGWYEAATHTEPDSPARRAFVETARGYYADRPDQLAKDWAQYGVKTTDDLRNVQGDPPDLPGLATAWDVAVAEQAFSTIHNAARKADPNHLNLGVRIMCAAVPRPEVFATMAQYVDVLSLNLYSVLPDRLLTEIFTVLPMIHALTGRPMLTSEFSYRGGDTLCPNTLGAPPTVPTQTDRAVGYLSYVSAMASLPFYLGVNWYTYGDDSLEKRWDQYGEDCNFGLVDGKNRPYAVLTETMRVVNNAIYDLAADPQPNPKCPLFWRTELTRWDRDWNRIFLMRYGVMDTESMSPLTAQLPVNRRFDDYYWVHHESPNLVVNDPRFYGDCQANLLRKHKNGQTLLLLGVRNYVSFPRALWYGAACENPDQPLNMEANAQLLVRELDNAGLVRRMTMADGSYIRFDMAEFELRLDRKAPYLDLRYNHEAKTLDITTRGTVNHLGLQGVTGWQTAWNEVPVSPADIPAPQGMTVFAHPETPRE